MLLPPISLIAKSNTEASWVITALGPSFVLYLVFDPGSWHGAPETIVLPWVKGVCFVLMRCCSVGWMRAGHRNYQAMVRILEFSAPLPILVRRKNGWNGANDALSLHKISKVQGSKSFCVSKHIHILEGWCTPTPGLRTLPELTLCVSSSGCPCVSFSTSFNKLLYINKWFSELWAALTN